MGIGRSHDLLTHRRSIRITHRSISIVDSLRQFGHSKNQNRSRMLMDSRRYESLHAHEFHWPIQIIGTDHFVVGDSHTFVWLRNRFWTGTERASTACDTQFNIRLQHVALQCWLVIRWEWRFGSVPQTIWRVATIGVQLQSIMALIISGLPPPPVIPCDLVVRACIRLRLHKSFYFFVFVSPALFTRSNSICRSSQAPRRGPVGYKATS